MPAQSSTAAGTAALRRAPKGGLCSALVGWYHLMPFEPRVGRPPPSERHRFRAARLGGLPADDFGPEVAAGPLLGESADEAFEDIAIGGWLEIGRIVHEVDQPAGACSRLRTCLCLQSQQSRGFLASIQSPLPSSYKPTSGTRRWRMACRRAAVAPGLGKAALCTN